MIFPLYSKPPDHLSLDAVEKLGEAVPLSEYIRPKSKGRTARVMMEKCAHCRDGQHGLCTSNWCMCGRKHGGLTNHDQQRKI